MNKYIYLLFASSIWITALYWGVSKIHLPASETLTPPVITHDTQPAIPNPFDLREESSERGLIYLHEQSTNEISGLSDTLGSGACVLDVNNDHLADIFIVGGSGHTRYYGRQSWWAENQGNALFINKGDGYFIDSTEQYAADQKSAIGMGCAVGDINKDGLEDIVVTTRGQNYILINTNGTFKYLDLGNKTDWSTSAVIADFNGDDWPDIYVANYIKYQPTANKLETGSGYKDLNMSSFQAANYSAQSNNLYLNQYPKDGKLRFIDKALELGASNQEGRSLGLTLVDHNTDGWIDIFIANDNGSPSKLLTNNKGKFNDTNKDGESSMPSGIRSIHHLSYQNPLNNYLDLIFMTTSMGRTPLLAPQYKFSNNFGWNEFQGNKFTPYNGWGASIIDLNNDGRNDIYHAFGLQTPDLDAPSVSQGQPDKISMAHQTNNNQTSFKSFDSPLSASFSSRSSIKIDIDNDGDKDLLITSNNNPISLLVNHSENSRWIGVDPPSYNSTSGKTCSIKINTSHRNLSHATLTSSFLGTPDSRLTLALLDNETVHNLTIQPCNGPVTIIKNPSINKYYFVSSSNTVESYQKEKQKKDINSINFDLANWQILGNQYDSEKTIQLFKSSTTAEKLKILSSIEINPQAQDLLGILKLGLEDSDKRIRRLSLNILRLKEDEYTYSWLERTLTNSTTSEADLITTVNIFEHFFSEEEALTKRKNLAIPILIKLLNSKSDKVKIHTIRALAKSRNDRASRALETIPKDNQPLEVIDAINHALGMLKRKNTQQETKGNISSKTFKEELYQTSIKTENENSNSKQCIKFSFDEMFNMDYKKSASILKLCPLKNQVGWIQKHDQGWLKIIQWSLSNTELDPKFIEHSLKISLINDTKILDHLIIEFGKTHQKNKVLILKSLQDIEPNKSLINFIYKVISNRNLSKIVRIEAGNILVKHSPLEALKYKNELF